MEQLDKKAQVYPLILNSSNYISNTASTFRYDFPSGAVRFKNSKIAIGSINIFNSWQNITASNENNTYQIIFPTNAGTTTITITMPDGFYEISDVNSYLQQQFIANGLYLVDSGGQYVYYAEFITNSTYYGIQFNSYPVPTALPVGYTNPAAMTFPLVDTTPQLVVASNSFQQIIGFDAGTYPNPSQNTTYSVLSTFTPQVSTIQSLTITCNLLNNRFAVPGTVLYNFSSGGTAYGSLVETSPNFPQFVDVQEGLYPYIEISFIDQSFNPITLLDTNLTVLLLILS